MLGGVSKLLYALQLPHPIVLCRAGFGTTPCLEKRMGKRVSNVPEWKREKMSKGPWWKKPDILMRAPIAKTQHPINAFAQLEEEISTAVSDQSAPDLPQDIADPYAAPPSMCILCPRKYAPGQAPSPSYLNPKLLSQFTSPHTGKVYDSHITGLCSSMQALVSREVLRSHDAGLMSTKVRNVEYLQDPQLFNSSRPIKPNPY
eukprot:TRINITY_DN52645_c0_g1_i1.p1 TRINITY_DN52645_c0_g1~~TRINITY_DN52645_c0_g1_i1.p1  ORF type:complete len:202 (-),score=40.48 TRINITY_DN52645_c0_g1_i1:74-679(-)